MSTIQKSGFIKVNGGVDEYHDPTELDNNKFQSASNIHIDGGKLKARPAKRIFYNGLGAAANGMHEYIDDTGTTRLLVHAGTVLYVVTGAGKTSIATGLTDEPTHFHTFKGVCFMNGATTQKKITGTTVEDVGLASPTTTASVATGAAGALSGSYAYKVTYAIKPGSATEFESNPSDFTASVAPSSEKVDLTSIPVSPDSRVTHRYIYRTTAGGQAPQKVAEIADNTTTTYTDNTPDDQLGAVVETNHGVPEQAEYASRCNERQMWVKGQYLRWSELGITDDYIEYQRALNLARLPQNGVGTGLKPLYNPAAGAEDMYIFQKRGISILPGGDPNQPLYQASTNIGCSQHDTIVEYNGFLVFLTNDKSVGIIRGSQYTDISTRSIPVSLAEITDSTVCRASIVFDHYYALTIRIDSGISYNTKTVVCDLRTITAIGNGTQANAVWYPWLINADYLLQRESGEVLISDNSNSSIFELSIADSADTDTAGTEQKFTSKFRTKNFYGTQLYQMKRPLNVAIQGNFTQNIKVAPYWWRDRAGEEQTLDGERELFIMGESLMGDNITESPKFVEARLPSNVAGNTFSFEFSKQENDIVFAMNGFQFHYTFFDRRR